MQVSLFKQLATSRYAGNSDHYPSASTATQLAAITSNLLQSSLQPSSVPTYRRAWKLYSQFSHSVINTATISLPLSPSNLGLFIAYMFQHQYAVSTTNTYVSALGYCHRLMGLPDPSKVFWVMEMLKGYRKMGLRIDSRLPITLPILLNINEIIPSLCSNVYNALLFKAMCTTAFFAFLRLGKLPTVPGLQRFFKQSRWSSLWICLALSWALRLNSSILSIPINHPGIAITLSSPYGHMPGAEPSRLFFA